MCQAKLIVQMPHDLRRPLKFLIFADEIKGPIQLHQCISSVADG